MMSDRNVTSVQLPEPTKLKKDTSSKHKGPDYVPHYLRPSTGSCHDMCKYGKPHVFVTKPPKRMVRRKPGSDIPIEIFVPENKTRNNEAKPRARSSSPSDVPLSSNRENPVLRKSFASIKQGTASSVRSRSPSVEQKVCLPHRSAAVSKSEEPLIKKQEEDVPVSSWRKSWSSSASIKAANRAKVESSGSTTLSLKSKSRPGDMNLLPPTNPAAVRLSAKGVARNNESKQKIRKSEINDKGSASSAESSSPPSRAKLLAIKPLVSSAVHSTAKPPIRRTRVSSVGKTSKQRKDNCLRCQDNTQTSSTEYSDLDYENVSEKILHVVKEDTPTRLNQSQLVSSRGSLKSSASQSSSSCDDTGKPSPESKTAEDVGAQTTNLEFVRSNNKKKAIAFQTNTKASPRRLSFRKRAPNDQLMSNGTPLTKLKPVRGNGKAVLELQTNPESSPRRLSLRRRVTTTAANNDQPTSGGLSRGMSFRRRVKIGKLTDSNPICEKVVLRHLEDIHGKKSDLGLFNEVIEATASRLVEVRKSRVKALVGAFETVIVSLQKGARSSWENSSSYSSKSR